MISIKSFVKQASIYSISNFVNKTISLFLLPLYTHYLSPGEYGMFDFIIITINLINLTIAFEIHQAIARFYTEWEIEDRKIYLSSALIFTLFIYTAFSIFVYYYKNLFAKIIFGDIINSKIIVYSIGMIWTSGIFYFTQSQLRWQLKSKEFGICTFIFTATTFLASFFLVKYKGMSLFGVINGLTIGNIFGIFTTFFFTRTSYKLVFSWSKLTSMLKFSTPLVFSSVSLFLLMYIDRLMIKNFLTFRDLGVFGIAYKFSSILSFLSIGVNNAILPLIYKFHKNETTPLQISRILNLYILFSFFLMSIISIFSRELILLFANEQYMEAIIIIPLLTFVTILASISNFIPGLFIAKKTKIIAFLNILIAAFSLVSNYFLIKKYGILGSCYANLFAYSLGFTLNFIISQKYYPISINFFKILNIIILTFVSIMLSYLINKFNLTLSILLKLLLLFFYIISCLIIFYSYKFVYNRTIPLFKSILKK
jgi:O-antigen/teichoic acid export membrane protein